MPYESAYRAVLVRAAPGLIVAGTLGCAIPARRAVRIDPVVTLRVD